MNKWIDGGINRMDEQIKKWINVAYSQTILTLTSLEAGW